MNVFNRIVVVVVAIFVVVAGLIVASAPEMLLAALQNWTAGAAVTPSDRVASAILGAALVLGGAVVLFLDLRRRPDSTVVVKKLADGTVSLEVASIARRLREEVEALEGVRQVLPQVQSQGRSVAVKVTVLTDSGVDVPAKSEEISAVVRETVAKMGVGLGRQTVHLRYEPGAAKPTRQTP